MKQAINDSAHRVLLRKQDSQLVFSINQNQLIFQSTNPISSRFLSTSSPVMRMCCCCMSC
jgi:hypothetical protein